MWWYLLRTLYLKLGGPGLGKDTEMSRSLIKKGIKLQSASHGK